MESFVPGNIFRAQKMPFGADTLNLAQDIVLLLSDLAYAIGKLPDINVFKRACLDKEAVLTSRIEGTTASLEDLYTSRITKIAPDKQDDIGEISAYVKAFERAVELRRSQPLDARLLRQAHALLLDQKRGVGKQPGEFRNVAVYIGSGTTVIFIPPPANYVPPAMENLMEYAQDKEQFCQVMIKAALLHYQFEAIHPFRDGNGRIGRMLIALFLHESGALLHPDLFYPSSYIDRHRQMYYRHLNMAHLSVGGLMNWVQFCLVAFKETAVHGAITAQHITKLNNDLVARIQSQRVQQKYKHLELLAYLFHQPVASIASVQEALKVNRYAAARYIKRFIDWDILVDKTGARKEGRYVFQPYLSLLDETSPETVQL